MAFQIKMHSSVYRTIWLAALAMLALTIGVLAYAWIDGGEEPLRPIVQSIPLPESAR